jgi:hypothetical protein
MYLRRFFWVGGFVLLAIFGFVAMGVNKTNGMFRLFDKYSNKPHIVVEDQFVVS